MQVRFSSLGRRSLQMGGPSSSARLGMTNYSCASLLLVRRHFALSHSVIAHERRPDAQENLE